jgi:hypothetical protein
MIQLKMTYNDGKDISCSINKEDASAFFDALNKQTVYWNARGGGFWTDLNKIRFINFQDDAAVPAPVEQKTEVLDDTKPEDGLETNTMENQ